MIKTKIIETTEKYDKDGKLVEKITREETSEDDEMGNSIATSGAVWFDETPKTYPYQNGEIRNGMVIFTNPPIYQYGSRGENHACCSCNNAKPSENR